jgi:oxygen-dependent protoporphyrinogen oxidase
MIGGARHPERLALDDGSLQAICADELGRAIGLSQPPRLLGVNRWPRAIPQYTVGHRARVAELDQALSARPGLHLAGNYLRGVGLNDCVREATALVQGLST